MSNEGPAGTVMATDILFDLQVDFSLVFVNDHLFDLFHRYALVGGMPEVVARYVSTRDVAGLSSIYQSLVTMTMCGHHPLGSPQE